MKDIKEDNNNDDDNALRKQRKRQNHKNNKKVYGSHITFPDLVDNCFFYYLSTVKYQGNV